jgi:hypothetical protein
MNQTLIEAEVPYSTLLLSAFHQKRSSARLRSSTIRASACVAPRSLAVFKAQEPISFLYESPGYR